MSKKDEVKVGGIMTRKNGKKYVVKLAKDLEDPDVCNWCAFSKKSGEFCSSIPCRDHQRKDEKDVYFIRLEGSGNPAEN